MKDKYNKVNRLYDGETTVHFETIHNESVQKIIDKIKNFKVIMYEKYPDNFLLHEYVSAYITAIRKMITTLDRYEIYLKNNFTNILDLMNNIGRINRELATDYAEPIFEYAKELYKRQGNYYIEKIEQLLQTYTAEQLLIVTRQKGIHYIEVCNAKIKVCYYRDIQACWTDEDVFVFIGSPELFGNKFKTVFLAKQYIFIAFDVFSNALIKQKPFIANSLNIFTIYDAVTNEEGTVGEDAKDVLQRIIEPQKVTAMIESKIAKMEQSEELLKFKTKFVRFANDNWMLIPLEQNVHCFDLEESKIEKVRGNKLQVGNFVIFQSQSEHDVIRKIADAKLGSNAEKYRKNLELWKKRLRFNVEKKGYEKVINILKRDGIQVANKQNIKNWISPYSIEPRCLKELLEVLLYDEKQVKRFVEQAKRIRVAHQIAGREIRKELMKELQTSKELHQHIQEKGFYKFESTTFKGSSFNVEEVRFIGEKEYEVPLSHTMILFRREN